MRQSRDARRSSTARTPRRSASRASSIVAKSVGSSEAGRHGALVDDRKFHCDCLESHLAWLRKTIPVRFPLCPFIRRSSLDLSSRANYGGANDCVIPSEAEGTPDLLDAGWRHLTMVLPGSLGVMTERASGSACLSS